MYVVVPQELCQLFEDREFEELVCGPVDYSVAHLRQNVKSSICDRNYTEWLYEVFFLFSFFFFFFFLIADQP